MRCEHRGPDGSRCHATGAQVNPGRRRCDEHLPDLEAARARRPDRVEDVGHPHAPASVARARAARIIRHSLELELQEEGGVIRHGVRLVLREEVGGVLRLWRTNLSDRELERFLEGLDELVRRTAGGDGGSVEAPAMNPGRAAAGPPPPDPELEELVRRTALLARVGAHMNLSDRELRRFLQELDDLERPEGSEGGRPGDA